MRTLLLEPCFRFLCMIWSLLCSWRWDWSFFHSKCCFSLFSKRVSLHAKRLITFIQWKCPLSSLQSCDCSLRRKRCSHCDSFRDDWWYLWILFVYICRNVSSSLVEGKIDRFCTTTVLSLFLLETVDHFQVIFSPFSGIIYSFLLFSRIRSIITPRRQFSLSLF